MENLPAALDLAAFEQLPSGLFQATGRLPPWIDVGTQPVDLATRFPLLELFLADCVPVFEKGDPPRLDSEIWEEDDPSGKRRYLRATALRLGARRLITIGQMPLERVTYQQLYHDFQLAEEEARRLKDVAERATRAKSDFLAAMSHEVRTPLNAIIGMADVLAATSLNAEQQRCVDVLQRNGLSLLDLINDILDLSKVEAGKVNLEAVPLDVREVIARAVEVIEGRAKAKGLTLRRHVRPDVPVELIGDPNRLRQVLINLLGNAVKFTASGSVEVRVERDSEDPSAGSLLFTVADTGVGIPEDKQALIFETFAQADTSTTRQFGGTGLGLAISRQLVELMGGRIWVTSQPGKGSTFSFTAKLAGPDHPAEHAAAPLDSPPAEVAPGLRILLADDSPDNVFLIQSYLKVLDGKVDVAGDGGEAARMFRESRYDLVLMDVEMPVMDGYMAAREIRRHEQEAGLDPAPVLALTAHAFADMAGRAEDAGFTGHLTKPIRRATLIEAVARYTGGGNPIEIVRVEPDMREAVAAYLQNRRRDVAAYRARLAAGDFELIAGMGHKMKGTGGGYGFPVLSAIGDAIERAARNGDAAATAHAVDRLARHLDTVKVEYPQ